MSYPNLLLKISNDSLEPTQKDIEVLNDCNLILEEELQLEKKVANVIGDFVGSPQEINKIIFEYSIKLRDKKRNIEELRHVKELQKLYKEIETEENREICLAGGTIATLGTGTTTSCIKCGMASTAGYMLCLFSALTVCMAAVSPPSDGIRLSDRTIKLKKCREKLSSIQAYCKESPLFNTHKPHLHEE